MTESRFTPLELWGGIECSVTRVGDSYSDQLERSAHSKRIQDLDLFAGLGFRMLRYPVLWERTAPDTLDNADWSWADARLARLHALHLTPIVGFLHHGSGPRHTSLVDPAFPEKFAQYAHAVITRYPWLGHFTPINEPLTTARFSGLYGHWYPHGKDERIFARALLNQCRATCLAMSAIRKINPAAQLIQTDDLGKTFSTSALSYQAEFENERRWLAWDLICGRVNRHHPLWSWMLAGVQEAELAWFLENPCPPDVIGVNYYVTSERFLDDRLIHYPPHAHGGNGRHCYADVEAVRVVPQHTGGLGNLLAEAWHRYQIPIAITEAHLGCTREEQMRWLHEVWQVALAARQKGMDIRAVTAWSLLGAYDWNSMLTCLRGYYEPGVFDLRSPEQPRPTALAGMLRDLASGHQPSHPVLNETGWWRKPERLLYPPCPEGTVCPTIEIPAAPPSDKRPLLITGANGTLGNAFARLCTERGLSYKLLGRADMDIANYDSVENAITTLQPWAVINAAGYVRVDEAEVNAAQCYRENFEGPAVLASVCAKHQVGLVTFSSDMVFDGKDMRPYVESTPVAPLNVYGASKAEAEKCVLASHPEALVIRTSAFFGPWDKHNFITVALRTLEQGQPFLAAKDIVISPTYIPDLVHSCLDLLIDGEHGIWHLANEGAVTWLELAARAADIAGIDSSLLQGCETQHLELCACRPPFSVLHSERGMVMPKLEDALVRHFQTWDRNHASPIQAVIKNL